MEPENWASCFGPLAGLFGIIETDEGELVFCGSSWVGRGGLCVGISVSGSWPNFPGGVDMKGGLRLDDDGSSFSVRPELVLIWPSAFSPGLCGPLREPWDFQSDWRTKGQMGQAGSAIRPWWVGSGGPERLALNK